MDKEKIKQEYAKYKPLFLDMQKEVYDFLIELKSVHQDTIHIERIAQRPDNDIKRLDDILRNIDDPKKYTDKKTLLEIGDIAGVRVTCHCISDRENFFQILDGELKQRYKKVIGDQKEGHYRAYHYNCAKEITLDGETFDISCEIQLRTVLGNAWAIQDHKYVYKNEMSEGDPVILSRAISDILNSCESLWDLVKDKYNKNKIFESKKSFDIRHYKKLVETVQKSVAKQKQANRNLSTVTEWLKSNKEIAEKGMKKLEIKGSMEIQIYLLKNEINISKKTDLVEAARKSTIRTFGWPIGLVMDRDEYKPKPTKEGIAAELSINQKDMFGEGLRVSYDYWSLKQDGSYYLLKSIFEDERKPGYLFFNTRIVRITEVLLFAKNLYKNLGVNGDDIIIIKIKHKGLKDRKMSAVGNRYISEGRISVEDEVENGIQTSIVEIESNIVDLVEKFTTPLFEIFDFFNIDKKVLEDIVLKFVKGEVS